MIAALLAGLVFFSLFAGQLPPVWLAAVCLLVVLLFLRWEEGTITTVY